MFPIYPLYSVYTLPAEILYVARTFADSQLAGCRALAQAAFDSGATLIGVNVNAARAQLAAANAASKQLLFLRDPQELVALTASQSRLALDRAQAYGRHVAGVGKDFAGTMSHTPLE